MTTECQHKYQLFTSLKGWTCAQCGVEMKQAWVPVAHPQPPATTPAMSREDLIVRMASRIALRDGVPANLSRVQVEAADYIDHIHPDLKPAPPKVEKSTGQLMVECWRRDGFPLKAMATHIDDTLKEQDEAHKLALESLREGMIGGARLWLQTIGHGGSKISDYDYSRLTDILNRVPLATTPEAK